MSRVVYLKKTPDSENADEREYLGQNGESINTLYGIFLTSYPVAAILNSDERQIINVISHDATFTSG